MKPLTVSEHIQLTLLAGGARSAWLVDSRFGEKDFSIEKFKKLVKNYKNENGEKIYKDIDFNTYDDKVIFAYNKLLTVPTPPKNGIYYSSVEIGNILGYIYPIDILQNKEDEIYTATIFAILKDEDNENGSSLEHNYSIVNAKNFEDILNSKRKDKNIVIQIHTSSVPKDKSFEPYNKIVENYIKAISSSKNDYLKSKLESHNFIRLGISVEYSLKYLIEKLLSNNKLSNNEKQAIKHNIFNLSGWEKVYHFEYNFDNKVQRFLIVNILTIFENNYGLELNEDDFLNLMKIADR